MNIVSVGPPLGGMTDLRSTEPDLKGDDKTLFARTLSEKEKSPPRPEKPGEEKSPEWSPTRQVKRDKPVEQTKNRADEETENGEVQKKAPRLEIPTKKDQQAKQKVIEKFMDSIESEFQIPSTRLVEAMAKLNTQDLSSSSEEDTADLLVAQLNLDPEEQEKAKEMYMGLLFNLDKIEQKSSMPYVVPVAASLPMKEQIQERFLSTQERRSKMLNSLDQMNQRFWMQKPDVPVTAPLSQKTIVAEPEQMEPITMGDLMREQEALLVQGEGQPFSEIDLQPPDSNTSLPQRPVDFNQQVKNQPEGLSNKEQALVAAALAAKAQGESVKGQVPKALPGQASLKPENEIDAKVDLKNLQMSHQMKAPGSMALASKSHFDASAQGDSEDSTDFMSNGEESSAHSLGELAPKDQMRSQKFDQLVAAGGTAAGAAATKGQQQEMNINQVMNQAQYLIKKGGGEMKVKLSPEGLGDLHLKVMLDGGKVNVQMSAETAEAKKTLESNLSELKQSLSAHKLSVDHVKVDVVNNVSSDVSSQLQRDTTNQQLSQDSRDTRQFWNQFQENFGSRGQKDGFNDLPNLRGYGQKRKPLEPVEVETKSRRTDGRGNGLNLVA